MNTVGFRLAVLVLGSLLATETLHAAEVQNFNNLNRSIPDGNWAGLSDTRSITSSVARLADVRVQLRIGGDFNGDLYAYLREVQPDRTNFCVLLNRPGRSATHPFGYADSGMNMTFDTAATNGDVHLYQDVLLPASGEPLSGAWQEDGRKVDPATVTDTSPRTTTLSSFAGSSGSGTWTLFVADVDAGGTNMLVSWALELAGAVMAPLAWGTPAGIVYGTPLSSAQLNATSPELGTFVYDPPLGTVLNAGTNQALTVTFTPTDATNYVSATTHVFIIVAPADLTIAASNRSKVYGELVTFTGAEFIASGLVPNDSVTSVMLTSAGAATNADVGSYSIIPSSALGAGLANYSIAYTNGTLTVDKASTAGLLVSSKNPALPGEQVTFSFTAHAVAPGAGTPDGTVTLRVDGTNLATSTLVDGAAAFVTTNLSLGSHGVAVKYAGSGNFQSTDVALRADQVINTPPVAGADTIERLSTNESAVLISKLLANDNDADGDTVVLLSFDTNTANGARIVQTNGWLRYMPPQGFTNDDSFSYVIGDGRGGAATGVVSVVVVPDGAAPNLTIVDQGNGSFRILFDGIPNMAYRIRYTDDLVDKVWHDLGDSTADDAGAFEYLDTPPEGTPHRFYRSVYLGAP